MRLSAAPRFINGPKNRPFAQESRKTPVFNGSCTHLNWVHGMALDSRGNIYAVDIKGKRAQKFVPQESPSQTQTKQAATRPRNYQADR
jgi:hypothetical protein